MRYNGGFEMAVAVINVRLNIRVLLSLILLQLVVSACSLGKGESEALASAKSSYENGNYSKTIIELKQLLQNYPANNDARELLARSYLKKGDGVSAEKEIKRVLSSESPTANVQPLLMSSWELQGKHKEILAAYEKGSFDNMDPMSVWGVVSLSYLREKILRMEQHLRKRC
jgi:tetratricopeptide (TPR) repeat protein